MDASSGDIDPNACINPELLSVLQHQRNASSSRLAGQNVRDTRSQQAACTPTQQRQQQQQQRRPFSELQNDDTYDSHINGHTGSDRANRNQHRSGSTQQSTPEQKSGGRRSGGDQRQGHVNRDSRSKSCNSALFRDDVFRQRFFGSPRPDAGHDVFSGGRLAVCPIVVPSGPPDFNTLVPRKALCHQFCRRTRKWTHTECRVRLSRSPFAKGSVRHAYYLKIDKPRSKLPASSDAVNASGPPNRDTKVTQGCIGGLSAFTSSASRDGNEAESRGGSCAQTPHADSSGGTDNSLQRKFSAQPGTGDSAKRSQRQLRQQQLEQLPDHECLYVAKRAIDPDCEPSLYFRDVEMQQHCAYYAQLFNEYNPPRKVQFLDAFVLELDSIYSHKPSIFFGVERHIEGQYCKHNNNHGYVETDDQRNTPQAFSHFTYEVSCQNMLVVDVQGVGDVYTDPQIHTIDGNNFGEGNLGARGFATFLQTHRCNSICRYLNLNPIHPIDPRQDDGTAPTMTSIQKGSSTSAMRHVPFREPHYYSRSQILANVDDSSSTALSHSSLGSFGGPNTSHRWRGGSLHNRVGSRRSSRHSRNDKPSPSQGDTPQQQPRRMQLGCRCNIM